MRTDTSYNGAIKTSKTLKKGATSRAESKGFTYRKRARRSPEKREKKQLHGKRTHITS